MSPSDFIIWLGGFIDALAGQTPTPAQWATINGKLDSVFNKVTPDRAAPVTRIISGTGAYPLITGDWRQTDASTSYPSRPYSDTAPTSGNLSIIVGSVSVTC